MAKPVIVIFGASQGGERFLRRCGDSYQVLGFCDNDPRKQGQSLAGQSVFAPAQLHGLPYDQIIVASMFGQEIKAQLVTQFGIPETQIHYAPKSALSPNKTYRPFEDPRTRELARVMLEWVDDRLKQAGIPYYVDHGTLLGLIRDGDLLPWDDDLDLSVPAAFTEATLNAVQAGRSALPHANDLAWTAETIVDSDLNRIYGVILSYKEKNRLELRKFAVSLWFMFPQDGQIRQYINSAPEPFFAGHDEWAYRGRSYPIPKQARDYLEFHYGSWQVPVKDMSLEEIQNYCPPPRHVRRDYLFGAPDVC